MVETRRVPVRAKRSFLVPFERDDTMNKIAEIVKRTRSLACATIALVTTSAAIPLMADGLAITPTEIPVATHMVDW